MHPYWILCTSRSCKTVDGVGHGGSSDPQAAVFAKIAAGRDFYRAVDAETVTMYVVLQRRPVSTYESPDVTVPASAPLR